MKSFTHFYLGLFLLTIPLFAQKSAFDIVPLGVKGGIDETNLSAYMLAPKNTQQYICLDAGTINAGIEKAIENNVFAVSSNEVLRKYIKGSQEMKVSTMLKIATALGVKAEVLVKDLEIDILEKK